MKEIEIILYVSDQQKSKEFYKNVLRLNPSLDVPGMTEFKLLPNVKLGLMPNDGIAKIITPHVPHPAEGKGIPRCELYLVLENNYEYYSRAIEYGGIEISAIQKRDWGDTVGYAADPDGHIIAFAKR